MFLLLAARITLFDRKTQESARFFATGDPWNEFGSPCWTDLKRSHPCGLRKRRLGESLVSAQWRFLPFRFSVWLRQLRTPHSLLSSVRSLSMILSSVIGGKL